MNNRERTDRLFDKAKSLGMTSAINGDGAPSRNMVAEAISDAELNAGQCASSFVARLEKKIEWHQSAETGNPVELDNAVIVALVNLRDAYKEAFNC